MSEQHTQDLLYGADAIGAYLGLTARQVRHRCYNGEMPHFKIGGNVCARKSTLDRWLAELEHSQADVMTSAP